MSSDAARMRGIERHALCAWPAAVQRELDGWQLRAMSGVTRRANSVWTGQCTNALTLAERIAGAERFYAEQGLPPMFQIGEASEPADLDAELARRGYVLDAPVAVQIAAVPNAHSAGASADHDVVVSRALDDAWLEISARQGRYRGVESTYVGLLERLGQRARFALASVSGEPAAVGLGVVDGAWMSVCSMLTLPAFRRRGLGRRVLAALAGAARDAAVSGLYLQVELGNDAAQSLYENAGFSSLYRYHYRVRPA